jgi:DNA-binding MarR family transcriptional regulator
VTDAPDSAGRDAVVVGSAWRDLRGAGWLRVFGDALLGDGVPLEASEIDALDQVAWSGEGRRHEIAAGLQVDPSTATRSIDRLERRGLVERRRDRANRRFIRVILTDDGRRAHAALLRRRLAFVDAVLDRFDADDRAVLVRLLPALADSVTDALHTPVDEADRAHRDGSDRDRATPDDITPDEIPHDDAMEVAR